MDDLRKLTVYECPECNALIEDYDHAVAHAKIDYDNPLPVGFAYLSEDKACVNIIRGNGGVSDTKKTWLVHGIQQPVLKYSVTLGMPLHKEEYVNSKEVRRGFLEKKLTFVPEELFNQVRNSTRLYETIYGTPLKLSRTLAELEE